MPDDVEPLDRLVAGELMRREAADAHSPLHGRDVDELLAEVEPRRGPGAAARPAAARRARTTSRSPTSRRRRTAIDLGPLEPRLPDVLRTPSGRIELAPDADRRRRRAAARRARRARDDGGLVLVGRRQLRSNNSWMHNLELLVSGPERCTLHVHPDDAARLGLADGEPARVREPRRRAARRPVEVTDAVMPGVVSLPHGWGHDAPGARLGVAGRARRASTRTLLADEGLVDALSRQRRPERDPGRGRAGGARAVAA